MIAPIDTFHVQWHGEQGWQDTEIKVAANRNPAWAATFRPLVTDGLRLVVTGTKDHISRIWEIEFYGPVEDQ